MSTAELKRYVDTRSPEEKKFLFNYLAKSLNLVDQKHLAEFDRRMDEMDAGEKRVSWAAVESRLDKLDRENK